jgi:hypothetical protein
MYHWIMASTFIFLISGFRALFQLCVSFSFFLCFRVKLSIMMLLQNTRHNTMTDALQTNTIQLTYGMGFFGMSITSVVRVLVSIVLVYVDVFV